MINKIKKIRELIQRYHNNSQSQTDTINSFSSGPNGRDRSSNKYYGICVNPFEKEREDIYKALSLLGIELGCGDYGDDFCLDFNGLESVLNALENIHIIK